jgi:hypothetical protein
MADMSRKRVTIPADVLANTIDGETVLLNLESERYFGLDDVGTRIWQSLTTSDTLQAAFEAVLAEYDVDPQRLRHDFEDLVARLDDHGLVRIVDEA